MAIEQIASSIAVYRKRWRLRVGIESGISWLKRCVGLRRRDCKGEDGFHAYMHVGVAPINALQVAKLAET